MFADFLKIKFCLFLALWFRTVIHVLIIVLMQYFRLDYDVAELTWENGHLSMHGLGQPRLLWDKPCLGGTLESIVDPATFVPDHYSVEDATNKLLPWTTTVGAATGATDALVPCTHNNNMVKGSSMQVMDSGFCREVESCRNLQTVLFEKVRVARPPQANASPVRQSKPQRETVNEENKKKTNQKSSVSTKRRRAAASHSQSERKRRDKINQRMQTLQKLVPNWTKIDKASMLDEVINYMKQLQAQVTVMNMSPMTLPHAMQQQLQMSVMAPVMGMGMGHVMDINNAMPCHPNVVAAPPSVFHPVAHRLHTPASMHDPMSAFLAARQSQPMIMDAYGRMARLYQHTNQNPGSGVTK